MCRVVQLLDPRIKGPTVSISDAHNTAINTLSWASCAAAGSSASTPCSATTAQEHLLLSMSFDPSIKIHDVRRPDQPYAVLCGHSQVPRCKVIQQASFCWGAQCRRVVLLLRELVRRGNWCLLIRGVDWCIQGACLLFTVAERARGSALSAVIALRTAQRTVPTSHACCVSQTRVVGQLGPCRQSHSRIRIPPDWRIRNSKLVVCAGGRGVLCGGEGADNTKLYMYDIRDAQHGDEPAGASQSSAGVCMLTATDLGHAVSAVQCSASGRFAAATGSRGSITVSKAVLK